MRLRLVLSLSLRKLIYLRFVIRFLDYKENSPLWILTGAGEECLSTPASPLLSATGGGAGNPPGSAGKENVKNVLFF
ncbi:MAG TPA: hypothetical protein VML36_10405, partial [Nitrospiria bacterium]|nr:hypothetical protein [Nitrospiria bacterium]